MDEAQDDDDMFLLYNHNKDGYHEGGILVLADELPAIFKTIVMTAKEEKRKVIITDVMDLCVFHMEDGEIIFPNSD